MSDIRVVSTGKIFWKIDPAVAGLLCEAFPESFAAVAAPAPAAVHARWTNSVAAASGLKFIQVQCPKCSRSDRFDGSIEHLALFEKSLCVHAGPCPDEVLAGYGQGGLELLGLKVR